MAKRISDATFAALLRPLLPVGAKRRLAVAMSGGADSTSLLYLAAAWGALQSPRWPIVAYTVDHGVRDGSAAEARGVAIPTGVEHTVLTLGASASKPSQAALRAGRLALLRDAAARDGCGALLLGHNAEDQLETVLQRLVRASGTTGLGGIAAAAAWSDPPLLRPLLSLPKAALIATCAARGARYVDDPSNPASERGRMRRALAARPGLRGALAPLVEALGSAARDVEAHAAAAEARYVLAAPTTTALSPRGGVRLALGAALAAEHRTTVHRLAARALQRAAGTQYPPRAAAVNALLDAAQRDGGALRRTHRAAGCAVVPESGGDVVSVRPWVEKGRARGAPS